MFRRLFAGIFAIVLTLGIGNLAAFAAPVENDKEKSTVERRIDAKALTAGERRTELPAFEKTSMAEYEREKSKARRMSTGKKIAIIGGIAAGVIIIAAIAVKNTEIRTF